LTANGTLNGTITATGGENNDQRGFDWGTSPGSYSNSWTESGSFGTGTFSHQITGLTEDVTIYFRAKSHNSGGWGHGSELSFQTYKRITPTDSGSGSETSISADATFSLTDSGAGAEASVPIAFTLADAGSGAESSLDLQAAISTVDSVSGSETSVDLAIAFSIADANDTSDEAVTLESSDFKDMSDSGSGNDSTYLAFDLTITETVDGADSWSLDVAFTIGDDCAASETITLDVSFTISDDGSDVEAASLDVALSVSDSGSGADAVASLSISFAITESGAGADTQSLTAYVIASEFSSGVDLVTEISTTFTIAEAAIGADAVTPIASFTASDSGALSNEVWTLQGYPLITETGVAFELVSKDFGVLEEGLGAEFAWHLKGSILIDSFVPPHVLSIRIRDEAGMDTRLIQGGSLPKQKMLGKPGRVVEIEGWTRDQDDIDDMEALMDGTARTFLHPSGDSFAVLVADFDPESSVDEYDRRIYRLTLKETR
jgi:flavin-binding protein dodecin